ncbi:hypothetical protein V6U81_08910 [Micromonospora sp. CPCC 205711]|uniref:hypothetical protein n=1 Tax=Micromonospora sp. CPCC 205547 TaxID=3122400 RepID=UPI002FF4226F
MTVGRNLRHVIGRLATSWRAAYGAQGRRAFGFSLRAVPLALRQAARAAGTGRLRVLARALLTLPIALASTVLTATLAFLVLINVLAYPFRSLLGLPGPTDGGYQDSWGGPTLAGAWAVHAGLVLTLVVPVVAWAVRGLTSLQHRLTGVTATRAGTARPTPVRSTPVRPAPTGRASVEPAPVRAVAAPVGRAPVARVPRLVVVGAAVALFVGFSLTAHAMGIGDNLLWLPRDLTSSLALAVTVAPLAALPLVTGPARWRRQH